MSPKVAVVIPWRPFANREYAFNIVKSWYEESLPDAKIITADDGRSPFCLSGTRNVGVQLAEKEGAEVIVLSDADTVPEITSLSLAISAALEFDSVILPYTEYRSLMEEGSQQHLSGIPFENCNYIGVSGACSGIYVFRPEIWWKHYGQDERFRGWGFEDAAWYIAHTTLLGTEPMRIDGRVYAFTHVAAEKEGPNYERNANFCAQYLAISGNVDEMRSLASSGLNIEDSDIMRLS